MYSRKIARNILEALKDTPILLVQGARQVGKSTLVKDLIQKEKNASYITFDSLNVLESAKRDPINFISQLKTPVTLDEVQYVPEILPALKMAVDEDRRPGQYILTGSANVLLLPNAAEYLVGRMELFVLWPLSQSEKLGLESNFVDDLFRGAFQSGKRYEKNSDEIITSICLGGYPELQTRKNTQRRDAWFESYLDLILRRDVKMLAQIEGLAELPHLLSLLATRISGLLNFAELSRTSTLAQSTLKRYFTLLHNIFLIYTLPAWSTNLGKRLVKTPKLYFVDTGLASYLQGFNPEGLAASVNAIGPLLENFVVMELVKQSSWSETKPAIYHYRTHNQNEIDVILEDRAGNIVAIEIKNTQTIKKSALSAMQTLRDEIGDRFKAGVLLYSGDQELSLEKKLWGIPLARLSS